MNEQSEEHACFVDVTELPIDAILALGDSALTRSLSRINAEINNPEETVAGHQSVI